MNKNASNILLLGESYPARYAVLLPNFETGTLINTEKYKTAAGLTFFGFQFNLEHTEEGNANHYHDTDGANNGNYWSNLQKKALAAFIQKLEEKALTAGADFVLIEIPRSTRAVTYDLLIQAKCQFLLSAVSYM